MKPGVYSFAGVGSRRLIDTIALLKSEAERATFDNPPSGGKPTHCHGVDLSCQFSYNPQKREACWARIRKKEGKES